jgi:hypothetical protein
MVVDFVMTDLLCMRLCSELSQPESNPRQIKAKVDLSIWSEHREAEVPDGWFQQAQHPVVTRNSVRRT